MALLDAAAVRPATSSNKNSAESHPALPIQSAINQSANEPVHQSALIKRGYTAGRYHWTNWANITHAFPSYYHRPTTVRELQDILYYIYQSNGKVRIVGCGHSPNDMAVTSDHMINMCSIDRLIAVDRIRKQITVQGGMQISELLKHLEANKLAMPSLGSIDDQTVGGILGSGTHGTGTQCQIVPAYVVALTLLKANGELIECSPTVRSDLFSACLVNLGCLGVITQITFQAVDAYDLVQHHRVMSFNQLIDQHALDNFISLSPYPRIHWFPHIDQLIATTMKPVPVNPNQRTPISSMQQYVYGPLQYVIMHFVFPILLFIAIYIKSFTPIINRVLFHYLHPNREESAITASRDGFIFDCLFAQYVNEWVIPREHTVAAMNGLRKLIEQQGLTVDFPIEVRFIRRDDNMLSPANMDCEDLTYIGIISFRPWNQDNPQMRQYFASFAEMMYQLGGRPHWAKSFQLDRKQLSAMYGENYHKFDAIRRECDTKGVFVNEYIKRLFEC